MNIVQIGGAACAIFCAIQSVTADAGQIKGNKLQTFSGTTAQSPDYQGYGGTSTLIGNGCARLDTTILKDNGAFAGVYISPGVAGKPIGSLNVISFTYHVEAGAGALPYFAVPIDQGDGTITFAFIYAQGCNDAEAEHGLVDLNCPVTFDQVYENWAAFAAAHPNYRISRDTEPFINVGELFIGTVCNVQFGKASAK